MFSDSANKTQKIPSSNISNLHLSTNAEIFYRKWKSRYRKPQGTFLQGNESYPKSDLWFRGKTLGHMHVTVANINGSFTKAQFIKLETITEKMYAMRMKGMGTSERFMSPLYIWILRGQMKSLRIVLMKTSLVSS